MAEPAEGNSRYWYRAAGRPFPGMGALASEMGEFERAYGSELARVIWVGSRQWGRSCPQVDGMAEIVRTSAQTRPATKALALPVISHLGILGCCLALLAIGGLQHPTAHSVPIHHPQV